MKKNKIIVSMMVFILMVFSIPTFADDTGHVITLKQAKELVVKNHPDIQKQLVDIELARVNKRDAENAYEIARANYVANLRELKNMVDGARKAFDMATYAYDDAKTNLDNLKQKVEYDIENQYFSLLYLDESIEILESTCQMQKKTVSIEELKKELGMSTESQLKTQRLKMMELNQQYQSLLDSRSTLASQFNRSIGRPTITPIKLEAVKLEPVYHDSPQSGERLAKELSLAIKQFNRIIDDKTKEIDVNKETASDLVEKLELEIKQSKIMIGNVDYSIQIAIKTAHENLQNAQKTLNLKKNSFETGEEDFNRMKLQFELGLMPLIVLDGGKITFQQKQAEFEKAVRDYYLAARKLSLAEKGIMI